MGNKTIFCPKCGTENPETQQRCSKCGAGISGTALVEDIEKDEMKYQQEDFSWKWVGIGFVIISIFHLIILIIITKFVIIDVNITPWGYLGLTLLPYFIGGILIGWLSPGKTFIEPVYASVLPAIGFPLFTLLAGYIDNKLIALAPILIYILISLFGAWIGEKFQGTI